MLDIMFDVPSFGDVHQVIVTKASVKGEESPILVRRDEQTEQREVSNV